MRYPFSNSEPTTDTLTIVVTDGTNVIENATVTIGEDSETTDATGKAEFELEYGDYSASISADGYTTATESLAFRNNHKNFTVTLESATGTGTVTVTATINDTPVMDAELGLSTEPIDWDGEIDWSKVVAMGVTGDDGTVTLKEVDSEHQTTEIDAELPFATYYLNVYYTYSSDEYEYNGTVTVDGDETVTITLTPIDAEQNG